MRAVRRFLTEYRAALVERRSDLITEIAAEEIGLIAGFDFRVHFHVTRKVLAVIWLSALIAVLPSDAGEAPDRGQGLFGRFPGSGTVAESAGQEKPAAEEEREEVAPSPKAPGVSIRPLARPEPGTAFAPVLAPAPQPRPETLATAFSGFAADLEPDTGISAEIVIFVVDEGRSGLAEKLRGLGLEVSANGDACIARGEGGALDMLLRVLGVLSLISGMLKAPKAVSRIHGRLTAIRGAGRGDSGRSGRKAVEDRRNPVQQQFTFDTDEAADLGEDIETLTGLFEEVVRD